jgi:outer membrane protein OmpA-like peptidoglycan-associated protein
MWSDRRANAVRDYLIRAGVPEGLLVAVGYGQERPKVANDTPENMAINRRIEFSVKPK